MPGRSPSDVIKPEVRRLSAYTLKHVKADVKLDQNENPYELPQELKEEVTRRVLARPWGRYPEFVPHSTTQALSKFTGWREDGILIGNGSNELIMAGLSVILGKGRKAVIPQPTFTLYKLLSSVFEAEVTTVPLNAADFTFNVDEIEAAAKDAAVTVICSPNNPTGGLLPAGSLERILKATPRPRVSRRGVSRIQRADGTDTFAVKSEPDCAENVFQGHVDGGSAIRIPDGASGDCKGDPQGEASVQRERLHARGSRTGAGATESS